MRRARSAVATRSLMLEPEGRGCWLDWNFTYSNSVDLGQVSFRHLAGRMKTLPPANKVQEVVDPGAQGRVRHAADVLAVEEAIDPADLPPAFVLDHAQGTLGGVGICRRIT